jgi:catechol 2,3-dioxygenase
MGMHMGHVALRVTDLERSVSHAKEALGLREAWRSQDQALLSANEKHHELQLIAADAAGFDHVGLEVGSAEELRAVEQRAVAAGARLLVEVPAEPGRGLAIRFVGPADIVYEIYAGMERLPITIAHSLAPHARKFGHLTFYCDDQDAVVAFWLDGLGFRVSDRAEGLVWTRCDADHHGLAVAAVPGRNALHHHAWEVQDWGALGRYCDDIALRGRKLLWGPVRHGPGFNLATYLEDPDGGVIEVYADLLQIADDDAYVPVDWSDEPRALNLWGPGPDEALLAAGLPILGPVAAPVSD